MIKQTHSPQGWWTPGEELPAQGVDDIQKALMRISKPIYLVEMEGGTAAATTGYAILGSREEPGSTRYPITAYAPALPLDNLGDKDFKARHQLKYPYIAGAMANGITSVEMVAAMAENGMTGFFGAGGLSVPRVEAAMVALKERLGALPFGSDLIHSPGNPELEMAVVNLYLKHGIGRISAAAFMGMTLALVYYRVKGVHRDCAGNITAPNQVMAKVSRIEVARNFFSPPPEKLVTALLEKGLITGEEAKLSQYIPMAQDLTAEADSGGHTDNRPALVLLPTMIALGDEFNERYHYQIPLCVGLAGGIATPQATAAAFQMGAAYVLTDSINQSCLESDTSRAVRTLLARAEQADVAMGEAKRRMDDQIWCGPGMGAFNQWTKGSFLEQPENRRVVNVALNLLAGAAIRTRAGWLRNQGATLDSRAEGFSPMAQEQLLELISM